MPMSPPTTRRRQKRSDLLANFLPELKRRRKRQQALQAISAAARIDVRIRAALCSTTRPSCTRRRDNSRPALDDLTAVETPGLSAQFFFRDTATGVVDRTSDAEANLAYPRPGAISCRPTRCRQAPSPASGAVISGSAGERLL